MNDDKVYYPATIADEPFPSQVGVADYGATSSPSGSGEGQTYTPSKTDDQSLPTKKIAVELIGQALNTRSKKILQEFQFTPSGALQIGIFTVGVNGDIRISPLGIVARNSAGLVTFSLDGESGDAIFKGSIQAGSLITGAVAVGDGNILIDGDSRRMIFYDEQGIPVIVIGNA